MAYYDLSIAERRQLYNKMEEDIVYGIKSGNFDLTKKYASDQDTYIRKNCYLIIGRLYFKEKDNTGKIQSILSLVDIMSESDNEKIRQTAVYALGEIGKKEFDIVENRLDNFLKDTHHSVKNGLTGAVKQICEKNPEPVFKWVKERIMRCTPDIRKRLLHGLELRGRTHPEELLPLLKEVKLTYNDRKTNDMLVHIIGQISYKKGCLEKVVTELKQWDDSSFVNKCHRKIIDVHTRYSKFSNLTVTDAEKYLLDNIEYIL